MDSLTTAQNSFGLALLQRVARAEPNRNVFLSPFSVATALQLVLDGAAGTTHAAIARTLHVAELPATELDAALTAQVQALVANEEGEPVFTLANAIWADKSFSLAPTYMARLQQQYQAEAATLDFAAPNAADTINDWVREHTRGKITRIVSDDNLQPPLVLANAIYFKGRWASEFNPVSTRPGSFALADGGHQQVPLMQQRSARLGYQMGPGWQAVQLPYEGYRCQLSMQLFVPEQPTGLPAFLAALTADNWAAWQTAFVAQPEPLLVDLTMPRFRLDWESDLVPALAVLGLKPALGEGADFTPMGFPVELGGFIGSILHKTFLAVDEQGTEAAAVTAVMMAGSGRPPAPPREVIVRANHPFFCAIVDERTGALLFGGAVYEPAADALH